VTATTKPAPPSGAIQAAAELFIYGYPLVYNLEEIGGLGSGAGRLPVQAAYNTFGHARDLCGPETTFVSPNNDTVYSIAPCDVRQGPLVLHVPDTAGRYYVLQFVDAWTNNFAYIGRRATGTAEGSYLLVGPGYDGDVPDGMTVVRAPSGVFVIVGRLQVDGAADLPAAHALQDAFTLRPLDGAGAAQPLEGVPSADPRVGGDLRWWDGLRVALRAFPPPAADGAILERTAALGLLAAESPFIEPDPTFAAVLVAGAAAAEARIEELQRHVHASPEGWQSTLHLFDYNLDHFEIGTLDAPEWKIADRRTAYVTRAIAARAGLWGNHGYEADYAVVWVDGDGQPLDGSHDYELHLDETPPVEAFWSLTMYAPPDFYLVANPIDRYSIGDRTPGLRYGDDGSVTIYLQHASPGADRASNWLPSPAGPFRPIMRMYGPKQAVLDGSYRLPAIRKVVPA
jgi:hypothetical protein